MTTSAFGPVGAAVPALEGWLLSAPQLKTRKEGGDPIGTFALWEGPRRGGQQGQGQPRGGGGGSSKELARFAWFLSGKNKREEGENGGGKRSMDDEEAAAEASAADAEAKKRRRSSSSSLLLGAAPEAGDELLALARRLPLPLKLRLTDLVVRGVSANGIPVLVPTRASRASRARVAPALPVAAAGAAAGGGEEAGAARPPPRKTPRLPVEGMTAAAAVAVPLVPALSSAPVRVCSSQQLQQQLSQSQAPALPVGGVSTAAATMAATAVTANHHQQPRPPAPPAPAPPPPPAAPFVLDAETIARVAAEISEISGCPLGDSTRALLVAKARQDASRGVGGDGETFRAGGGASRQQQSVVLSREEALKARAVDWLLSRKQG